MTRRFEARWPVALTICAVIGLLTLQPGRIRVLPNWIAYVSGITVPTPIAVVGLTGGKARWLRIEHIVTLLFFVAAAAANLVNFGESGACHGVPFGAGGLLQLLGSSVAVWVTNVLMFSLLYWQIDRSGPEARVNDADVRPDWLFPQRGLPPRTWRPAGSRRTLIDCSSPMKRRPPSVPPT